MNPELRRTLHRQVVSHLDARNGGLASGDEGLWKKRAEEFLGSELRRLSIPAEAGEALRNGIIDEIFAYGPITAFLADPAVTEIMVNGKNTVYVERGGKVIPAGIVFLSDDTHLQGSRNLPGLPTFSCRVGGSYQDRFSTYISLTVSRVPDWTRLRICP